MACATSDAGYAPFAFSMSTAKYWAKVAGIDEVFLWINQGLTPVGEVLRGLELFAERVMPRFA